MNWGGCANDAFLWQKIIPEEGPPPQCCESLEPWSEEGDGCTNG